MNKRWEAMRRYLLRESRAEIKWFHKAIDAIDGRDKQIAVTFFTRALAMGEALRMMDIIGEMPEAAVDKWLDVSSE